MCNRFTLFFSAAIIVLWVVPSSNQAADLKSILDDISKSNPSVMARQASVGQGEARLAEARAGYFPTAVANGAIERRRLEIGGPTGQDQTFTAKSLGIEARQPLFRGFQTSNSVKVRREELASGRSVLQGTRTSVFFDAVRVYMDVMRDRKIARINQTQVELIQSQLAATRTRLSRGEATRTDESQAEARLAVTVSGRVAAQESLGVSEAEYQRIIGQVADELSPVPGVNNMPVTLDEAQSMAFAENPDIAAAKANERAAEHGVAYSKGFLLPSVDAVAGVDYLSGGVANLFTGALPEDRKAFYGGVQAQVPIFQGGSEYAGIRRAKEFLNQRKAERAGAERDVADQVAQSWVQWQSAKATIESARAAVTATEKAAEGVRRESIGGNRTVLDVLDAQREMLDARVGLERAIRNEYVARAAVMAAIGRLTPENFSSAQASG
jgi:outer membrane protein